MRAALAVALAFIAGGIVRQLVPGEEPVGAAVSRPEAGDARIETQAAALAARFEASARDLEELPALPEPSAEPVAVTVTDAEIEAALQRWRSAHGTSAGVPPIEIRPPEASDTEDASPLAALPASELAAALAELGRFSEGAQALYEELRASGRMDDLISYLEREAENHPEDAELQLELGTAYLQKLFGLGPSPEAGVLAAAADAAFDRAIEADPSNLEARYVKAISLSNWPPFLGKTGQAIEQFELLIASIEERGDTGPFVESYLYLGNLYERTGDHERALETWRKGLALDPANEALLAKVESESR
ncbi:MAG TPA: tetratricopeptide repeat protein [Planctomycetes bacterium]|nr:tetratricopeptide repeat protein [Planctomycetota bacterium]